MLLQVLTIDPFAAAAAAFLLLLLPLAGGFSEQQVSQLLAAAGLRLVSFSGNSLHVTKAVAQPGGVEAPEAFPVFVAVGQAAADLR